LHKTTLIATMPLDEHNHEGNNKNNGEGTLDKALDGTK
jgi:hypothetical protein